MKALEQLILSKSRPVQKEAKHIGVAELDKLIMEALLGEAPDPQAQQHVRDFAKKYAYDVVEKKPGVLVVKTDERDEALDRLQQELVPLGFIYDPYRGGTKGRFVSPGERGKTSQLIVLIKQANPRGGAAAAAQGAGMEEQLAQKISQKYGLEGVTAKTAGFGHGSDLEITALNHPPMTIEVKTALGADFGQFRIGYDLDSSDWTATQTKGYKKFIKLFHPIFKEVVGPYMDAHAKFTPEMEDNPSLNIRSARAVGLKAGEGTGDFKKQLQSNWFSGKTDVRLSFDFDRISDYYSSKGDRFIQIGRKGLYALNDTDAALLGVPYFGEAGLGGIIRIRIKPHSSYNGIHSFTVAIKITGKLKSSNISLTNDDGLDKLIQKYLSL